MRGKGEIIGAGVLTYEKKIFLEAVTFRVWKGGSEKGRERERNID